MRTLLDSDGQFERRTAIVARELARSNIDIAALSETRISDVSCFDEVGADYKFFCCGHPEGQPRQAGVGFAIRGPLARRLDIITRALSPRLMTLQIQTQPGQFVTLVSAYAPTMMAPDDIKEAFYEQLNNVLTAVPRSHRLYILGDFNARVGRDFQLWPKVLGHHGVGSENSNGTLLLQLCASHQLAITNTAFQQANKYKNSWMHPRSKHWHLLDYVITRQADARDVNITRVVRGSTCWSDHCLVRSTVVTVIRPQRKRKPNHCILKKLDVRKLASQGVQRQLVQQLEVSIAESTKSNQPASSASVKWLSLSTAIYSAAAAAVGPQVRKHKDWFDEQDKDISKLLDDLHRSHEGWIGSKCDSVRKDVYLQTKRTVQRKLRAMKESWWASKAAELQGAADKHDLRGFYENLRHIYGPCNTGVSPVLASDGATLLTERGAILERWAEHFNSVLNRRSCFDPTVIDELPLFSAAEWLDAVPTPEETASAVKQLVNGKAPGEDAIPPEVYKAGGPLIIAQLTELFAKIWDEGAVPAQFKNARIVHIFKRKGNRACCDDHRGISLLSTAGKILARVILNRLVKHVDDIAIIPESQCGFRAGRGTTDMIFSARQLQEKCREQRQDLFVAFVDLTKAFDTVNREGLWMILRRIGCPDKFVSVIQSFHDGMTAYVLEGGEQSAPFDVTNGTKQGCVLAPMLFSIYFSMMLQVALKDCVVGVDVQFRTDGDVFNSRRLQARTKTSSVTLRDLLFADDCALVAHALSGMQELLDRFSAAAQRFGLTVSVKKTEVMHQSFPVSDRTTALATCGGAALNTVDRFCYLGSILSRDASLDSEIGARLAKASGAFGLLRQRLWNEHGVRLATKVAVYKAAVLTTLLFGCETWTLYRRHLLKLDQFHLRCLRQIMRIQWQDKVTNTDVLQMAGISGIESMIMAAQFRWAGHVARMPVSRIPKMLMYGQLSRGTRQEGAPLKRYKDGLKANLKACGIDSASLGADTADRAAWRKRCREATQHFEERRSAALQARRAKRKAPATGAAVTHNSGSHVCPDCGRVCLSAIGLHSHITAHRRKQQHQH